MKADKLFPLSFLICWPSFLLLPLVCHSRLALGQEKKSNRAATCVRCGPSGRFLVATSFIDFQAAAVVTTVASVHGERLQRGGSSTRARRLSPRSHSPSLPSPHSPSLFLPFIAFLSVGSVVSVRLSLNSLAWYHSRVLLAGSQSATPVCVSVWYTHAPLLFVLLVLFDLIVQHQKQHFFVAIVFSLAPSGLSYPGQCLYFQFRPSVWLFTVAWFLSPSSHHPHAHCQSGE